MQRSVPMLTQYKPQLCTLPTHTCTRHSRDNKGWTDSTEHTTILFICTETPSLTKSMFSHLFRQITQIIRTIYQNTAFSITNKGNTPNIHNIWNNFHLPNIISCRTEAQAKYSGLDTNPTAIFSNNTGYTLQLQASTQLTTLRTVLDHNPNAFMTV